MHLSYNNSENIRSMVAFDKGVSYQNIWFDRSGRDLEVKILGTQDKLIFKDWFTPNNVYGEYTWDTSNHINGFHAEGHYIGYQKIENISRNMSSYEPGDGTSAYALNDYDDLSKNLQEIIRDSWTEVG